MEQEGIAGEARLMFLTHLAREGDMRATLDTLAGLDTVGQIGGVLRIVGDDG
jgi:homoserine dehydrogenase